jgi:Xaa-Pro aminopeptidase
MRKLILGIVFIAAIFTAQASAQIASVAGGVEGETFDLAAVQKELKSAGLDGWLFYDFRGSDPLASRILKLKVRTASSRRWYYYVPATGEPTKIVHSIEQYRLDELPGKKLVYAAWELQHKYLRETLRGKAPKSTIFRVAMQYSANNNIPYVSRVDAGTIELIRGMGIKIESSGDLIQQFEAVFSEDQFQMHKEASEKIYKIIQEAFGEIKRRINANIPTTEYDIQQYMFKRYDEEGLTSSNDPPNVSVNANAANPHYEPTEEKSAPIKKGDLVLFDVWAKVKKPKATYTDLTWMGYVGDSVPQEYVKVWNVVRDARDAAFNFVKTSMRDRKMINGAMIDDISRGVVIKAGYGEYFTHRTGHNIGEEVHGSGTHIDNFETKDTRKILARTCFSIEPGIYLPGKWGIRSEMDTYITGDDAISVVPVQKEIIAILK